MFSAAAPERERERDKELTSFHSVKQPFQSGTGEKSPLQSQSHLEGTFVFFTETLCLVKALVLIHIL